MRLKVVLLCSLMLMIYAVSAVNQDAGTSGFAFLKVPVNARAISLGESYTAQKGMVECMYYNPSGLVYCSSKMFQVSYLSYLDGYQGGSASAVFPISNKQLTVGVGASYLSVGDIERTLMDDQGNYAGTNGSFHDTHLKLNFSAAKPLSEMIQIGVGGSYIQEAIDGKTASAIAGSIGLFHQPANKKVQVGVSIRNFGKQLSYFTDKKYEETLPLTYSAGLKYSVLDKLEMSGELSKSKGQDIRLSCGAEYSPLSVLAFRLGYKSNGEDWKMGGDSEALAGLSAGVGIEWNQYKVDYAYSSMGDVGSCSYITLGYKY